MEAHIEELLGPMSEVLQLDLVHNGFEWVLVEAEFQKIVFHVPVFEELP